MAAAPSAALGPIVGGILTDSAGWRWIFWLNIPVGLAAFGMSYRYLPESRNPDGRNRAPRRPGYGRRATAPTGSAAPVTKWTIG